MLDIDFVMLHRVGVQSFVCLLNKVDVVDVPELLELVEMELRGLSIFYVYFFLHMKLSSRF